MAKKKLLAEVLFKQFLRLLLLPVNFRIKGRQRCAHTKLLLLIQNCMLQRLYSINIYSLQKNMVLEPFKITGKNKQTKR